MINMQEKLNGKNINFLIGSGASFPIFKTLSLGKNKPSFEELISSKQISEENKKILYYFYYKEWILPMINNNYDNYDSDVKSNYLKFVSFIISTLSTQGFDRPRRANIFTTNYDLLFEDTFEKIINEYSNCFFNDGSMGFMNKTLNPNWYNLVISQMGYNDKYKREIPTINLLKMHGSVSWRKEGTNKIKVSYEKTDDITPIEELEHFDFIDDIISHLGENYNFEKLNDKLNEISQNIREQVSEFFEKYKHLAIINPNKWKFHDTVFEQHYYQLIRNFSYELEKENSILIVFAFSFADEHILEIFKRILSNPNLEVIIITFSRKSKDEIKERIGNYNNISYYPLDEDFDHSVKGDFNYFNKLLQGEIDG